MISWPGPFSDVLDFVCGFPRFGGTLRACLKSHYRSESIKFHWLIDFNSLGIALVDLLEDSSSATELLSSLSESLVLGSVDGSGEHTSRIVPYYLRCLCFEVSIFAPNIIVGTWLRTVLGLPCDYVGGAQIGQVVEDCLLVFRNKRCSDSGTSELVLHLIGKSSLLYEILWGRFYVNLP
ncbi:hypothetical protein F2Q69_00034894 [Brassica cretica]|uniref:Uncharacterized protein n=1 Tax=Brassica cretica TaxID=69181 RepID=A0A8S9SJE6_BRACR|nr:hypothetical protein F2Q69_00034894 [Brassica cretica]